MKEVSVCRLGLNGLRILIIALASSLCGALICSCARPELNAENAGVIPEKPAANLADQDRALQQAATEALGDREGAVLVIDPQNGRLRAIINPRLAFEQAFPPGSTMKTFTALTALRSGLIDGESRAQCRGHYRHGDYQVTCSHPKSAAPFNPSQALGYSCNCYFADLASRLSPASFGAMLDSFGFGKRTGVNAGGESQGTVPGQDWYIGDAVGEGKDVTVTVVQLLTAYAALLNGGHLYRPQQGEAEKITPDERAAIRVDPLHRQTLIKGMRAAVEYGTAAEAGLTSLPFFVFGKTGTSAASNGFGRHGWFVAFAADPGSGEDPPPEALRLGLVVLIKRGLGAESAKVARPIFGAFAKLADSEASANKLSAPPGGSTEALQIQPSAQRVRVANIREGKTETLLLDDYVLGVLAGEATTEDEIEALKAQAITTRTFALKNLGRHASEGYDFCSLTHCELYKRVDDAVAARPLFERVRRAVADTAGETSRDERGQIVDAYFSAACGGVTANIESLWGAPAPSYLRGVRDDYCATGSYRNWTEEIPRARLARALASDARSDVGARVDDVVITRRDATGRAQMISLEGERRRQVRGWEFKIIVGRALGWNVLKSSRFEVARRGASFLFRGSGFGHGLGLCQQGAHVMARRGMSYRQILSHYFPGTSVGAAPAENSGIERRSDTASIESGGDNGRLTLSSEHFRVGYPSTLQRGDVESLLRLLEAAHADLLRRLAVAGMNLPETSRHDVVVHATTQDFVAATGQPWWTAGATRGRKTEVQPIEVLRRRRVLASTLRHEYTHALIEAAGHGRTPRWLAEGLAIHAAGEGEALKRFEAKKRLPLDDLDRRLASPASGEEMRSLYAAAYREVIELIRSEGESSVWRRVRAAPD